MQNLYSDHREAVDNVVLLLPKDLELFFYSKISPVVKALEIDPISKGITKKSYNLFARNISSYSSNVIELLMEKTAELLVQESKRVTDFLLDKEKDVYRNGIADEVVSAFLNNDFWGQTFNGWFSYLESQFSDALSYSTFPGRRLASTVISINKALSDITYPNSPLGLLITLVRGMSEQIFRDTICRCFLELGRSRVLLVCNDDNEVCSSIEGEYDVRFVPEVNGPECSCYLDLVEDEPVDYPQKVYVDGDPIVVPIEEEIQNKKEVLKKLNYIKDAQKFEPLLELEIAYMEQVYSSFGTNSYKSGKEYGKTKLGRNTVSFGDEIELLAQYIYGGQTTELKAPVDVINPVFCIETKACSAMETTEDERGHIATDEVVRKYLYISRLIEDGETRGFHKYVLGVFDDKNDTVRVYEQNYLSNKNSSTMLPVCLIENYSKIRWNYESTPYREFKVSGILDSPEVEVKIFRSEAELNDPFFWEVVRAHRFNTRDGDRVEYFDGKELRRGILYDESVFDRDRSIIKFTFDKYHNNFPRRATYSLVTTVDFLLELMSGDISFSGVFQSDIEGLVDQNDDVVILEFEDLHHLPNFRVNNEGLFSADSVDINYLKRIFMTDKTYKSGKNEFKSLKILPVVSKRRVRRVKGNLLEFDFFRPVIPAFQNGLVIKWENDQIEEVDYNTFNSKYRLLKQGIFETLDERGLEVPLDINEEPFSPPLSVEDRREYINEAKTALNSVIS